MFTRHVAAETGRESRVTIRFKGRPVDAVEGQSVASALAAAGFWPTRYAPSGAPRFAYCMMGVCFECLVSIDGMPDRQSCLVPVREGMEVWPSPAREEFR